MKNYRIFRALLGWLVTVSLFSAPRIPVEDFAREPAASRAQLSPDGQRLAFIRQHDEINKLHVTVLDSKEISRLNLGSATLANGAERELGDYSWISNQRLIITTVIWDNLFGVLATNWDGTQSAAISGMEDGRVSLQDSKLWSREVIHRFNDPGQHVLMLDRREDGYGNSARPDVLKMDTTDGTWTVAVKNPGKVSHWSTDSDGVVRLGIQTSGEKTGALYRENEKAPWRTVLKLEKRPDGFRPIGFEPASERILLKTQTAQKRGTIAPLDPNTGVIGEPLLADPEYDILPERFIPSLDGQLLAAPIFSRKKDKLLGVRYVTDAPRVTWFDPAYSRYQASVDRALPNTVNLLVDTSLDGKRLLWFGFSDQNPGGYYLADLEKRTFKPVLSRMSWIKPEQMAPMLAITYKARDGLLIHGFLTVPVGHKPEKLPLVVMPHGGPWVRDIWGFDPLVQMIANRGYAVLQMNYRGSSGYGQEFFEKAQRQIGLQIQDDIEDATRWAIAAGVADPKRIAIMGASYGGYSALFAVGHNPELYRCGISIAGVTDWLGLYADTDVAESQAARRYWTEQIGDISQEKDLLKSISPLNFAANITAPTLIIHGKEDRRVPVNQARRMIAALEKNGRKPESLILSDVGHNYGREKPRTEIFKRIAAFLEKNLGPGVD